MPVSRGPFACLFVFYMKKDFCLPELDPELSAAPQLLHKPLRCPDPEKYLKLIFETIWSRKTYRSLKKETTGRRQRHNYFNLSIHTEAVLRQGQGNQEFNFCAPNFLPLWKKNCGCCCLKTLSAKASTLQMGPQISFLRGF